MTDTTAACMRRRLWTAGEYHRMGEAGLLHEDDRVELIEGEIVEMTPIGVRHAAAVKALVRLLSGQAGDRYVVSVQDPVWLSDCSEPQPDLMLLRWRDDFYREAAPTAADVVLLVEVADTSLATDRAVKLPLYSRAGIPEVWIVDLAGGVIEVHTGPSAGGYDQRRTCRRGDVVATTIAGLAIGVSGIIGD